jgi:hypothetical protein
MTASPRRAAAKEITVERWGEMLLFAAKAVDRIGPKAQPILDRCEREYLAAKLKRDSKGDSQLDRVRKLMGAEL